MSTQAVRRSPAAQPAQAAPAEAAVTSADELTPRQRQIMDLLRAGKVNKEIARELGIGVGTVKQHVVTLFKRLKVSNRTMAVSRGLALDAPAALGPQPVQTAQGGQYDPAAAEGALERRPCVVLSLGLPAQAGAASVRRLHELLAALACELDAVFLARRDQAGDLIFGLHQVGERDVVRALHCAQRLHASLLAETPALAGQLRGGLAAGIVVASMLRHGGWSGEAIVSTAIGQARELQARAAAGQLTLARPAQALMAALGVGGTALFEAGAAGFAGLARMDWRGERAVYPLVGRSAELKTLERHLRQAAAGAGHLLLLEGESGMGKSRLCQAAAERCAGLGGKVAWHRVRPDAARAQAGADGDRAEILALLRAQAGAARPTLAIVDDVHFLAPDCRAAVLEGARVAARGGALVILSGRPLAESAQAGPDASALVLRRLAGKDVAALVRAVLARDGARDGMPDPLHGAAPDGAAETVPAAQVQQIVADAAGVPLFAVELAHHRHAAGVALALLVTVLARLDGLHLDRKLLRAVARRSAAPTLGQLAALLGETPAALAEAARRACASGVLQAGADGTLDFGHPLLRKIFDYLSLE